MDIINNSAKIDSQIKAFATQGKKRAAQAHLLAVSCLNHANEHGDLTKLSKLFHAFGKTENPQEFKYWVSVFSGKLITWDKEGDQFKQRSKGEQQYPVLGNMDIEGAKATAWWDLKKVKEGRDFNPEKDAKGVLQMLTRHAKEASEAGEHELAEAYTRMANEAKGVVERVSMLKEQKKASVKEIV